MKLRLLIVILLSPASVLATAIVAIRTPDSVVLSADCKPTYVKGAGSPTVCKIFRVGDFYFAIGGLDHDSSRGVDIGQIVADSIHESDVFQTNVEAVVKAIQPVVLSYFSALRDEDPEQFAHVMSENPRHQVVVFMMQFRNAPFLAAKSFNFVPHDTPSVEVGGFDAPLLHTRLLRPRSTIRQDSENC